MYTWMTRQKCPAIQAFDHTKTIFDWTLFIDRPLFQALGWAYIQKGYKGNLKTCFETS